MSETNKQPLTAEEILRNELTLSMYDDILLIPHLEEFIFDAMIEFADAKTSPFLEEIAKLKEEKEQWKGDYNRVNNLLANEEKEHDKLKQTLSLSKKENEELKNNINDLEETREINTNVISDLRKAKASVETAYFKKKEEFNNLKKAYTDYFNEYQENLNRLEKLYYGTIKDHMSLESELTSVKEQLADAKDNYKDCQNSLLVLLKEKVAVVEQNQKMTEALEKIKIQLEFSLLPNQIPISIDTIIFKIQEIIKK